MRKGSAAQLSRVRGKNPAQVDAEEASGHRSQLDHHEREDQLKNPVRDRDGQIRYPRSPYHARYRGRYFCDVCGKAYTWKPSLMRHKREECGKEPRYACPVCHHKIRRSGQLKLHLFHVHNWPSTYDVNEYRTMKFVCDNCGKAYKWRESLQQHRRLECGIEPQFGCIFCGRRFKHKHHLKEHLKRRHKCDQSKLPWINSLPFFAYRPSYLCNTCGKTYKWKESLNLHKRMECGISPRFACKICGRRFKHKHHLTKHHKSIHNYVDQWQSIDEPTKELERQSYADPTAL
ncbi:PREDICTED: zinc finger protein CKR1-like [Dufourea novaeangliae]|uniref:zinc finger protein CKR1-like n=1 Tax=Dufourea novaeangliae TaxID=178035 RepID=UPI0007671816|nr:PREDICTED: zinc finger protein CKR1-like [Dufourea novaeangliae]